MSIEPTMTPPPTIGIISIGEMGLGVAKLLNSNGYRVVTTLFGRSEATKQRAHDASIEVLKDDEDLVSQSHLILSIVPPRDARTTAERIVAASLSLQKSGASRTKLQYYLDLNAISPSTTKSIASLFSSSTPSIEFIDGGIIGSPPKQEGDAWKKPSIPISGPNWNTEANDFRDQLSDVLNLKYLGTEIGMASGLKASFAALSKGFTALAIQSFSTAEQLGVLPELKAHLQEFNPAAARSAEGGIVGMPKKAYRWIAEMNEIADTFRTDGGWNANVFDEIAKVYSVVANETQLGDAGPARLNLDDVVEELVEGLRPAAGRRKED